MRALLLQVGADLPCGRLQGSNSRAGHMAQAAGWTEAEPACSGSWWRLWDRAETPRDLKPYTGVSWLAPW